MKERKKIIHKIISWILVIIINTKIITFDIISDNNKKRELNAKKYSQEIDEYNQNLENYAKYIKSLNLTDLQIIMKVIDDQWEKYKYGTDEELLNGFYRLSFQEKGYGVCTSFADDFTAKMNAINPAYEAKNVYCYIPDTITEENIEIVDIERRKTTDPEFFQQISQEPTKNSTKENIQAIAENLLVKILYPQKLYGNHMVSMIKIPNEDYYLIIDPTNLMIGLIKDGEIYIFNTNSENTIEYVRKGNIILGGKDCIFRKETYYECDNTLDEIAGIYGYEEQLEALQHIQNLDKHNHCFTRTLKK